MALLMTLGRMNRGDITAHGFRSTFRDWAAERTNFPSEVVEMALAHVVEDKTEAAYRRGDLFDKQRRLMDAWANYCAKPAEQGGRAESAKSQTTYPKKVACQDPAEYATRLRSTPLSTVALGSSAPFRVSASHFRNSPESRHSIASQHRTRWANRDIARLGLFATTIY